MKWKIDYDAIADACCTLGVVSPVKFRLQKNLRSYGQHLWIIDHHRLNINSSIDRKLANRTVWHELTHAAQCDRYGVNLMMDIYEKDLARYGYKLGDCPATWEYETIPFEAEANAVEDKHANEWVIRW